MNKAAYIEENKAYLGQSLAALERMTEEQFETLTLVTEHMGEHIGGAEVGIDNHPVFSTETLEDFENSRKTHWKECKSVSSETINGRSVNFYEGVQLFKGQQRRDFAVVQFDECTVTLS